MKIGFSLLQIIGGAILASGYIPQILQIIRTRKTRDLNRGFWISVVCGIACMEVYAIHLVLGGTGHAFLITNTSSLLLSLTILFLKLLYG